MSNYGSFGRADWYDRQTVDRVAFDDVFRVALRRRYVLTGVFISLFGLACALTLFRPAVYKATAVAIVGSASEGVEAGQPAVRAASSEELKITTVTELLQSRKVAAELVQYLAADDDLLGKTKSDPSALEHAKEVVAGVLKDEDKSDAAAKPGAIEASAPPQSVQQANLDVAMNKVMNSISVRRIPTSRIIEITAEGRSPEAAATYANGLVEVYRQMRRQEVKKSQARRIERLTAAVEEARTQLYNAEIEVAKYMKSKGLLAKESGAAIEGRIASLQAALANAQAESASRRLNLLEAEERQLQEKLASLQVTYGPGYPEVQNVTQQLQELRAEIAIEKQNAVSGLSDRSAIDASAAALQREVSALKRKHFADLEANAGLNELENKAAAKEIAFKQISEKLEAARDNLVNFEDEIEFLSKASGTSAKTANSAAKVLAIGAISSLLLGFLAAFAAEGVDQNVRSSFHVRRHLGAPTLAMVPHTRIGKQDAESVRDYVRSHPESGFAQALRNLYMELAATDARNGAAKVVVITSVTEDGGKNMIANGLAEVASMAGARSMLVALDHSHQLTPAEEAGERQRGGWKWGVRFSSSTDEHAGRRFAREQPRDTAKGIAELSAQCDFLIVETPPILQSREAKAIAPQADHVAVIVEWGKTKPAALRAVQQLLDGYEAVSAVISRVNVRAHMKRAYGDLYELQGS
jgi:uncharacterized protein involved in exopolysaccharide biosynthesis